MTAKMRSIMEKGRWTDKRDTPQAALAPCRSDFLLIFARSAQKCGVCTPQNPTGRTAGFSRRSFPCKTKSHSLRNDFCFGGDKRDRTADLMTASCYRFVILSVFTSNPSVPSVKSTIFYSALRIVSTRFRAHLGHNLGQGSQANLEKFCRSGYRL